MKKIAIGFTCLIFFNIFCTTTMKKTGGTPVITIEDIQQRIDQAQPGDTLKIPPGRYNVDLVNALTIYNKLNLTLIAEESKSVHFFSQRPDSMIITIDHSSGITLEGFHIYHELEDVVCIVTCSPKSLPFHEGNLMLFEQYIHTA